MQALAADEAHGVIRPAVGVGAQAVDGHHARVLQPAGDLRFEDETAAADRVVGVLRTIAADTELQPREKQIHGDHHCQQDDAESERRPEVPLALLEPLARIRGVTLVSMQKEPGSEQIGLIKERFAVVDLGSELADFTDTAAVMKCLDLVITCDTAAAPCRPTRTCVGATGRRCAGRSCPR